MADWADSAAILLEFADINESQFRRVRKALPAAIRPERPSFEVWGDGSDRSGAGISLWLWTRRGDGRGLSWGIELYIYRVRAGEWQATAKGEIDIEDGSGEEHCVFNEQKAVANIAEATRAIRELAAKVTAFPIDELLAMNWQEELGSDRAESKGATHGTLTTTVRAMRRNAGRVVPFDDD